MTNMALMMNNSNLNLNNMIYLKRFNEAKVQEANIINILNNGMVKVKRNELPFFFDMMRSSNVSFRTFGFEDTPPELYFTIINNKVYHNTTDSFGGKTFKVTDFSELLANTNTVSSEMESDVINDYMTEITDSYYFEFSTSLHSTSSYYIYKLKIPNECISEFTNQWMQANKRIKMHFSNEIVYSNMILDNQERTNYTITIEVKI